MNCSYRILCPAICQVGILFRLQVSFKDGFQYDHQRRLYDTVGDRRYPQGTQFAVRLWNPDPLDRFRSVVFLLQPFRQLRPACSPSPLQNPLHRRLQPLRYLHDCSSCYRPERKLPGGIRTRWKTAPLHGARYQFVNHNYDSLCYFLLAMYYNIR